MFYTPSVQEVVYDGSYSPLRGAEVSEAYASVLGISFDVRAGLLVRQAHHWSALIFVASVVLHLMRVFFTGAFRKPREINWVIGLLLLLFAIVNGFTGYTLGDDLLSGTGLRITHSIILSIPVVGTWLAFLLFGGEFPGTEIIGRLFVLHVLVGPGIIAALIAAHLGVLWRQKHAQFRGPGRTETNVVGSKFWPNHVVKMTALFFGVLAVVSLLGGFAQINPVWLYGPFDPAAVPVPAQPDWFLGWVEGALRLFPGVEVNLWGHTIPNVFFPGILMPLVTFGLLLSWPWLEARLLNDHEEHHLLDRPRDRPVRTALGAAGLTFYGILLLAGSNDIVAFAIDVPVLWVTWVYRILLLIMPATVGLITWRFLHVLQRSDADRLQELPLRELIRRG